ncbi:hypothetical protein OROHE_016010 [Orobanche hederae]
MAAGNRARRKRADCDDGMMFFHGKLERALMEILNVPTGGKVEIDKFQSVEEFINSSPFQLVDAQRFSSHVEALLELNAIST